MKRGLRNTVILSAVLLFCIAFSAVLTTISYNVIERAIGFEHSTEDGTFNAVAATDFSEEVKRVSTYNYVPNTYVSTITPVTNARNSDGFTDKGTIGFYITAPDANDREEYEKTAAALSPLLGATDNNWHLTMYIPPIFSACSVFVRVQNKAVVGSLSGYDPVDHIYGDEIFHNDIPHKTATKPLFIDISIPADPKYTKDCYVTIHYEANPGMLAGSTDSVLLGPDAAVRKAVVLDKTMLLSVTVIAAVTFCVFIFICILKRSLSFVPQLLFAAGVFLALVSTYSLTDSCAFPYLAVAMRRLSIGVLLTAAMLYAPKKSGKFPTRYTLLGISTISTTIAFISSFVSGGEIRTALKMTYSILAALNILAVVALSFYDILKNAPIGLRLNNVIVAVIAGTAILFGQKNNIIILTPALWLCTAVLGITIVMGFRVFTAAELQNRYLTDNLKEEVSLRTRDLKSIIEERDKLLLYVSHDMKKPVLAIDGFLVDLKQQIKDDRLGKKVDFMLQKTAELKNDFNELGKYGKTIHVSEQSEVLDACEIISKVCDELRPDCDANGIILNVIAPKKVHVYAKIHGLTSITLNLILNAIEHAKCSQITVSVRKSENSCRVDVTDDGIGIRPDIDVFKPFVSDEQSNRNFGLGLYLAKESAKSMGGDLTYKRENAKTVFTLKLPMMFS